MVAFDLLTGLYIRAIYRMTLIPAPLKSTIFSCFHIFQIIWPQKTKWGPSPIPLKSYIPCMSCWEINRGLNRYDLMNQS